MKRMVIVILLLSLAACVNTRSIPYETISRPAKPDNYPIEILDVVNISRPYKVIGVVEANAGKNHSPPDTIEHLKQEARKMGGEALIELQRGAGAAMLIPSGNAYVYGNVREIWAAKVIVWQ
jgi:hypothetical protein